MSSELNIEPFFYNATGPAAVAIAIAVHDHPNAKNLKVHFIEKQPEFGWHKGMLIPGYRVRRTPLASQRERLLPVISDNAAQ